MKKKIVIKVQMDCDKCRSKALKIAAGAKGVNSVSLEGTDKDQVAVTGEHIDSVCLAKALRKKFGHANILSVEQDKDEKHEKETPFITYYPLYPPNMSCEYQYDSFCIVM